MLKKLMILPIAAGMLAVNAGAACYQIGTADELDEFASIVNSSSSAFTGCAELTADIHYLGNANLLNSSRDGVTAVPQKQWTPLKNFAGTFDGQDHTIYGLYVSSSDGAAFIRQVSNATSAPTIKNLHIADSYFNMTGTCKNNGTCYGSAGLVSVVSGPLTIDKCSFSGVVASTSGATKNGGLVSSLTSGASVEMVNSYNEGNVAGAGLVGDVASGGSIVVGNCYNVGKATQSPLMGARSNQGTGIQISGSNLGCVGNSISECTANFTRKSDTSVPVGTFVSSDPAAVIANFWTNVYGGEGGETSITNKKEQLEAAGMAGLDLVMEEMKITYLDPTSGDSVTTTIKVPVAKIKITLDENQTALVMPENLDVYGVIYERKFAKATTASSVCSDGYNPSTTVLPFTMDVDSIKGGSFYKPDTLFKNTNDEHWTLGVKRVTGNIEAHQPYILCPSDTMLTFKGSTIVKQTDGVAGVAEFVRKPAEPDDAKWKFIGLYSNKTFGAEPDSGREYGFSGGKFLRMLAGKSSILRAYLLAPAGSDPSTALSKVSARVAVADVEEAPSQIIVKVTGSDYEPFAVATIDEAGENEDGGTLAIKRPMIFPKSENKRTWTDIKGRSMNRKPSAKGVYLHNGIPTITK